MKQIVLGTAGHIDHGKTSLIKAVTGINTDRLKEEQLRGITIELGFAALDMPDGRRMGIVDVPGHEKFVKNMVAGATGIDLVALVIAADEGVMPQTREHMEICTLLDIQYGLVVLTKIDMVDQEWLDLVREDVAGFTQGSFLENAPVTPVSVTTGQGIPDFVHALEQISSQIPSRTTSGLFRLPVDRVFTMKGFGTVITGTLISGKIVTGEHIVVYPSGIASKVRGLQVHGETVPGAEAGMRTAINFQGLDKAAVDRGDVIAAPGTLRPSYMVDIQLRYLSSNSKALKNRTRVRFHTGTSEIMGIVVLLDCDKLVPGESALAQIRLDTPVTLVKDDRYVLRSYSPVRTIGGGQVLNPTPLKHKRNRADVISYLSSLSNNTPEGIVEQHLKAAGFKGRSFSALLIMANVSEKQLEKVLQALLSQQVAVQIEKEKRRFVHQRSLVALQKAIEEQLGAYHQTYPLKPGMPKEELKSKLPPVVNTKLFLLSLQHLKKNGRIEQEEDMLRLSNHHVALGTDQQALRDQILTAYETGGLSPPYFKDVCQRLSGPIEQAKQVLFLLLEEGLVIKVKEDLYYHRTHLEELKHRLVEYLASHDEISTPQFKDMTGASRKFVIPLLEYFDSSQLTIRVGDVRRLRRRSSA